MIFSDPVWNVHTNSYKVRIIHRDYFLYEESRVKSSGKSFYDTINVNNDTFKNVVIFFADAIHKECRSWFATPIKPEVFLKKVKHTFDEIPTNEKKPYGNTVLFRWSPYELEISAKSFEISWELFEYKNDESIIPSDFIDFSEDLELNPRTIVIQKNDIIENAEISFDNSEQDSVHQISSRAILKQKVRKAKLKAAIATMKAERMAEKYFRRYGIETKLDSDSDISFDSEEEESEEE